MLRLTVLERGVAFVKFERYLSENVSVHAWLSSMVVQSSSSSSMAPEPGFILMAPEPISPSAEKVTPSLSTSMTTELVISTRVGQVDHVATDALELLAGHADRGVVDSVRDAEVLRVDVHELEVVLAHAVVLCVT